MKTEIGDRGRSEEYGVKKEREALNDTERRKEMRWRETERWRETVREGKEGIKELHRRLKLRRGGEV